MPAVIVSRKDKKSLKMHGLCNALFSFLRYMIHDLQDLLRNEHNIQMEALVGYGWSVQMRPYQTIRTSCPTIARQPCSDLEDARSAWLQWPSDTFLFRSQFAQEPVQRSKVASTSTVKCYLCQDGEHVKVILTPAAAPELEEASSEEVCDAHALGRSNHCTSDLKVRAPTRAAKRHETEEWRWWIDAQTVTGCVARTGISGNRNQTGSCHESSDSAMSIILDDSNHHDAYFDSGPSTSWDLETATTINQTDELMKS